MSEQINFNFDTPEEKVKKLKASIREKRVKGEKLTLEEETIVNEEIEGDQSLEWFQK